MQNRNVPDEYLADSAAGDSPSHTVNGPVGHEPVTVFETQHRGWAIVVSRLPQPLGVFMALATNPARAGFHAAVAAAPAEALHGVRRQVDDHERKISELLERDDTQPGGEHFLVRRRAGEFPAVDVNDPAVKGGH